MGFDEGRNVVIDYRYAEHQNDQLPTLIADLVRRQVELIYAADNPTAVAAKAANATIPIVFRIGGDPVQLGLVASLSRPGGNITGVSFLSTATTAIRLQMLHEAVPNAAVIGLIVNTANPSAEPDTREAQEAARKLGLELHVVSASNTHEIDAAIASIVQRHAHALVIGGDALLTNRRQQFAALAMRHALPAAATTRDFPEAGLLMSYGDAGAKKARFLAGVHGLYTARSLRRRRLCKDARGRAYSIRAYSICAPEALMMGAHFASSALMNSAVLAGVMPGVGSIPASCRRWRTAGSASALVMAALSASIIG